VSPPVACAEIISPCAALQLFDRLAADDRSDGELAPRTVGFSCTVGT
jgi:hypothetical protein